MKKKNYVDQIFALIWLVQKFIEKDRKLFTVYVTLEGAVVCTKDTWWRKAGAGGNLIFL